MTQSLEWLNALSADRAEAELLKCCGSTAWAKRMNESRPFATRAELAAKADQIWRNLSQDDWLEAFRAHPKIGERKAEAAQSAQAQQWSAQEQSASQQAAAETKAAIADGNQRYERRFGYIFIICASGRSAEDIVAALTDRLSNDQTTELAVAAEEQVKITQLRLKKLIES